MLKALIKSLENKPLNPGPLESLAPLLQLNWRRIKSIYSSLAIFKRTLFVTTLVDRLKAEDC
jgi:hypothetical protein